MLHISLTDDRDLGGEIYRQLRRAIVDGVLRPGDRLSPSRELAETLQVARATVVTAYERLVAEGFVETRQGAGTFVSKSPTPQSTRSTDERHRRPLQPNSVWEAIPLPTAFDASAKFDFRTGMPDASLFPHRQWRRLVAKALRAEELRPDGKYGSPAGHFGLRSAIARHVALSRGIVAAAEDVVITNGTQQAINLVVRTLLRPGDRVAMEVPGYEVPRRAFQAAGLDVVGVTVDREGLVVDALPDNTKAIYVTPSHQYPLTVTMSLARRRALLTWADRHGAAVIEDDYDGEFRFDGRPLEPLQTLDANQRVIYVGSISKTLLPSLRLGFLIVPPTLHLAVQKAKYVSDWHSPHLEQAVLAEFIEDGGFSRHVRKLRTIYLERHRLITETIRRDFAAHLELVPSTTGLTITALARSATIQEISDVAARAATLGVEINQLSSFFVEAQPEAGIVLGYGGISATDIKQGLSVLRDAFVQLR